MLAIKRDASAAKLQPNLLPCKIRHDGPVSVSAQHWTTTATPDGSQTAYFRGRKLAGTLVKLPDGYEGAVLKPTTNAVESRAVGQSVEDPDMVPALEVKVLQQEGSFDDLTVWGHECVPSPDDKHVRAIQEWIAFAERIHSA